MRQPTTYEDVETWFVERDPAPLLRTAEVIEHYEQLLAAIASAVPNSAYLSADANDAVYDEIRQLLANFKA